MKVFWYIFSIEVRKIFAYRLEFWSGFLGQTFITILLGFYLWSSIFKSQSISSMHGMDLNEIILYYALIHITTKILIGAGQGFIFRDIYYGTLNKYLLYPLSFISQKMIAHFTFSLFFFFQMSIFIVIHKFFWGNNINFESYMLGSILIFTGSFVYLFASACLESIAFWTENVWSLLVLLRSVLGFAGGYFVPLVFYPEYILKILNYTPFPYILYHPTEVLMQKSDLNFLDILWIQVFWVILFFFIYKKIWNMGRLKYTGVGI